MSRKRLDAIGAGLDEALVTRAVGVDVTARGKFLVRRLSDRSRTQEFLREEVGACHPSIARAIYSAPEQSG